jgi:hypothetical protein
VQISSMIDNGLSARHKKVEPLKARADATRLTREAIAKGQLNGNPHNLIIRPNAAEAIRRGAEKAASDRRRREGADAESLRRTAASMKRQATAVRKDQDILNATRRQMKKGK